MTPTMDKTFYPKVKMELAVSVANQHSYCSAAIGMTHKTQYGYNNKMATDYEEQHDF
jgi:hypothetical protein